jgi:aminotransferase
MLDPGDEVLIPQPSYVSYVPCTILAGGVPVVIELEEKDQFRLTREKLLEKITDKTKVLVLPFPNNPTGAIMEREDLEAVAKVVEEKDLFVISDEIYAELTYKKKHMTIASLPGMRERTVLINGFSKDGLENRLRLRAGPDFKADVKDPPVRHHVRSYHQPVRGGGSREERGR